MSKKTLIVNQLKQENVTSDLIEKIYNICVNQDLGGNYIEYDDLSLFSGILTVNNTYREYITLINNHFPDLIINASNYLYYFKDPVQRRIVNEVFRDESGNLKNLGTLSNLDPMFNHEDFNDIQIFDLTPFTSYNFLSSSASRSKTYVEFPYLPTSVKYFIAYKTDEYELAYWKFIRPSLIYTYSHYPNWMSNSGTSGKGSYGALNSVISPSYLWDQTNSNPVNSDTIVINDLLPSNANEGTTKYHSQFGWWYHIGIINKLYLNWNGEYYWTYQYASNENNGKPTSSTYQINDLYVPESTYEYYSSFFDQMCNPSNIHVYDFVEDSHHILPQNKEFII